MAKKITPDQVIEKNLWQNTIDSTKLLIEVVDKLDVSLKKVATDSKAALKGNSTQDFAGLKGADEEVKKVNKAFEDKIKLDKQRLVLQNQLEKARLSELKLQKDREKAFDRADKKEKDAIKKQSALESKIAKQKERTAKEDLDTRVRREKAFDKFEKKKQQAADREKKTAETLAKIKKNEDDKLTKIQIKELEELSDVYGVQSKRLNTLRKQYKNLLLTEGKTTKQTRKLGKEVKRLDRSLKDVDEAAGQFQRNVGNYPDTLGKAATAMAAVAAGALSVDAAFSGISTSLNDNAEGSENVREITSKLGGVFDQVKNVVSATALDLFDYGAAHLQSKKINLEERPNQQKILQGRLKSQH